MPEARVELARGRPRRILSPLRLPFRHSGEWSCKFIYADGGVNSTATGYSHPFSSPGAGIAPRRR